MATIKNTITLQDKMTPVLRSVIKALNSTVAAMAGVDKVSNTAFNKMKKDVSTASIAVEQMDRELKGLGEGAEQAADKFTKFKNPLVSLSAGIYAVRSAFQGIGKVTDLADQVSSTTARLNLMNDGLQTTQQLQSMILDSANASRTSYVETASAVSKLGILAGDSFSSNQEMILFAEQMNKQFKIGGASIQEQTSAMYQLTQAMASGILQGDEFRTIRENAPLLAKAIADYTGKSIGELKEMGSQGLITSDIIKSAMFAAMDETNRRFKDLPMTFGQSMTLIKNNLINTMQPILTWMSKGAQLIADNWERLVPVFLGVAGGIGVAATAYGIWTAVTWLQVAANQALLVSLLSNPFLWIAIIIGLIIAKIYEWVRAVGGIRVVWLIVTNALLTAWDNVKIAFFTGVYWVIDLWDKMKLGMMSAGIAIANFMGDMKANVLMILQNMVNGAIDIINGFINTLNKLPGVSIEAIAGVTFGTTAQLENDAAKSARNSDLGTYKSQIDTNAANRDAALANMKSAAAIAQATREIGISSSKAAAAAKKEADAQKFGSNDIESIGKVGEVGKIRDDVSIADEDIKLLKDVAATEFINKYMTLRPEMSVSFGDVRETADVNKILSVIEDMVEEAYASSLVGEGA